ncbi:MAG: ammonium transporter [Nitrospirae bacterium]|nr:ammonium transporter [Nitrospirota bacterium]
MKRFLSLLIIIGLLGLAGLGFAEEAPVAPSAVEQVAAAPAPTVDTGDTSWILISSALVMLMTPGLALFYGGMVRRKNVLGTIMQSFIALGVMTIDWVGLKGVGLDPNPDYAATIPHQAFMIFQMMFAVITPALITGAFAERFKFSTYLVFLVLWATLIYFPLAHWVWGVGGWIRNLGALDFAGGLVVHISSGVSALAAAIFVGKRKGYGKEPMMPHNITMTLIGASLLWFGWFGTSAFVVTHIATAAAALSWMFAEWKHRGKPTALGAASGAVAGLVAITPASGFVGPMSSIIIGLVGGVLCYMAINLKSKLGYDDSLDVVGVHGVGGTWGAIATGLFASKAINAAGNDGLFFANPSLLVNQLISVGAAWVYSFVITLIILKLLDATMGLRVDEASELAGLDHAQHGESGYAL